MEHKAKIFARWVLTIHLLLLVVVIGLIFFASKSVYEQARHQAMDQAEGSQELLAKQTADGIKAFYDSIRDDLDLIHRADDEEPSTQPTGANSATNAPSTRASTGAPIIVGPFTLPFSIRILNEVGAAGQKDNRTANIIGLLLWRQLDSRASLLFSVDVERLTSKESAVPVVKNPAVRVIGPPGSHRLAKEVALKMQTWLSTVEQPSVSNFQEFGELGAGNVVCIPAPARPGDKNRRLLVAYVPIQKVRGKFLDKLNPSDMSTAATLADGNMVTMVSSDAILVGINALRAEDLHVRELAQLTMASNRPETLAIEQPYRFGNVSRQPRMMTMVPVSLMGQRWYLMVSSRLAQVDAVVNRLFKKALYWAIFVVVAMTGILVSTSITMIRGRARLERARHLVLKREIDQAREIQKAWLPSHNITLPQIDISAVNRPANHISGDFYNWFELPDGRLVITIGDVTGHGMSAAFLMATTQLLVRTTMMRVGDPGRCMEEVNRQLCTQIFVGQFVTMLIVVLDLERGEAQVATAGHYPPLLGDGMTFTPMSVEPQLVLGVDETAEYPTEEFVLPVGASLLLYTDGVLDVEGTNGKRYGRKGLTEVVAGRFESAQALVDALLVGVDRFRGSKELPDDLTFVAIQLATSPKAPRASRKKEPVSPS